MQLSEHYHARRDFEKFSFRFTTTRHRDLENVAFALSRRTRILKNFDYASLPRAFPTENFARAGPGDSCWPCRPPRPQAASLPVEHMPSAFRRPDSLNRLASSVAGGPARPMRVVRDFDLPMGETLTRQHDWSSTWAWRPEPTRQPPEPGRLDSKTASARVA